MLKTKYGAKKTLIDGIKFDSKLEANVYSLINEFWMPQLESSSSLLVHPRITLTNPSSHPFDKRYNPFPYPVSWKPDFIVTRTITEKTQSSEIADIRWLIEAKGIYTVDFVLKLRLLACNHNFDWSRFIIVSDNKKRPSSLKSLKIYTLQEFKLFLATTSPLTKG
jgi:hypothetical protein